MAGDINLLVRPTAPPVEDIPTTRWRRKRTLAIAFRIFASLGFENGSAGHAAVRDPEQPELFWMNSFGMPFRQITPDNLILVDEHGNLVEGTGAINHAGYVIHSQTHAARADVTASIHLHPTAGMAFSALGIELSPLVQDACAFYEDHAVYDKFAGPVLDLAEANQMAKVLGPRKALILQNHGLLTVGQTVDEAAWWMIRLNRSCEVQLMAQAAGPVRSIAPDVARATAASVGTPHAGWFSFQPMLEGFSDI